MSDDRTKLKNQKEVVIPKEIQEKLEAAYRADHYNKRAWAPWQDLIIREHWHDKHFRKTDLAEILGVSYNTAKVRARELGL